MKTLKFTYKNGNSLLQKNVNEYEIADGKIYMSIFDFSNRWIIINMDNIVKVEEV